MKLKQIVLFVFPILLFLMCVYFSYNNTVDDAFISLRYAKNFVSGSGLVYNVGEYVEGYSNLLWIFILALFHLCSIEMLIGAKLIGILSGILVLVLTTIIARKQFEFTDGLTILLSSFLATKMGFIYYAISGLETIFFLSTVMLFLYLTITKRFVFASIGCCILILLRPEGILFLFLYICILFFEESCHKKKIFLISLPLLTVIGLSLFRYLYYHSLLPNTFTAKINVHLNLLHFFLSHSKAFFEYTAINFSENGLFLVFAFFGIFLSWKKSFLPSIGSLLILMFFIWFSAGDWMDFYRFYVHVLPLILLFSFAAISVIILRCKNKKIFYFILTIPILLNITETIHAISMLDRNIQYNPAMHSKSHIEVATYLKQYSKQGDRAVMNEIGAIGFYTDLSIIDMLGIVDCNAATLLNHNLLHEYAAYILSKEPKFILLNNRENPWDNDFHPIHKAIYLKMMSTGLYRKEKEFPLNYFKSIILFVRK